jgi:dTDP-4-amino-4,6-dideoxygalactose transaminase
MRVPFIDLDRIHRAMEPALQTAFSRVLRSQRFVLGDEVDGFERACAEALRVPHAIGVSSGTDALLASLMALGVGPGDEVVCPAYSFFATAGSIARLGAMPIFADVDRATLNVDINRVERALTKKTRAIVVVHLFGRCADAEALRQLADARGIHLIEDAAQSFGAVRGGRVAGGVGTFGCFSFFPTKNLGALGDAGLVTTSDADRAAKIRSLRIHGARSRHEHEVVGGNFRIDAMHAALLAVKLPYLEAHTNARREAARAYVRALGDRGLTGEAGIIALDNLPTDPLEHVFNQLVVRVRGRGRRDALRQFLAAHLIDSEVYYPVPLPLQPCFASLGHRPGDFPIAEAAAEESLALPIFPGLTAAEIDYVAEQIAAFARSA